jgi:hypothetical protein
MLFWAVRILEDDGGEYIIELKSRSYPPQILHAVNKYRLHFYFRDVMEEATGSTGASSSGNDTKRSKICAVCQCESETFHLNFGVSTCNSCRAFFRRSVQNTHFLNSDGGFVNCKCKNGARCKVSIDTRRSCRWCRFTACKEAGMVAEGVLQEEDKKRRFRHAIERRQAKTSSEMSVTHSGHKEGYATLTFGSNTKRPLDSTAADKREDVKRSSREQGVKHFEIHADLCSAEVGGLPVEVKHDKAENTDHNSTVLLDETTVCLLIPIVSILHQGRTQINEEIPEQNKLVTNQNCLPQVCKQESPLADDCKVQKDQRETSKSFYIQASLKSDMNEEKYNVDIPTVSIVHQRHTKIDEEIPEQNDIVIGKNCLPQLFKPESPLADDCKLQKDQREASKSFNIQASLKSDITVEKYNVDRPIVSIVHREPTKIDKEMPEQNDIVTDQNCLPPVFKPESPLEDDCKLQKDQSGNGANDEKMQLLNTQINLVVESRTDAVVPLKSKLMSAVSEQCCREAQNPNMNRTELDIYMKFRKTSQSTSSQFEKETITKNITIVSEDESCSINQKSLVPSEETNHRRRRIRDIMSTRLHHVQQTWNIALKVTKPIKPFVHALVAMHLGYPELINKDIFCGQLRMLANVFQNHALQQPEFQALSPNEQARLVKKNAPTFVLYMLVGYMSADDGLTQLSWLLANRVPNDVRNALAVTPDQFNAFLGLFSETSMKKFSNMIKDARWWSLDECYLVSLACLFNDSSTQGPFEDLLTLGKWAYDVYWIGSGPGSIHGVIQLLEKANIFLEGHMTGDKNNYRPFMRKDIMFNYTVEEDLNMTALFKQFDKTYGPSVLISGPLLKAFVDYFGGIPFPQEIASIATANSRQRMHHLLFSMCEGFSNLSSCSQARALTINTYQAMMVNMTKLESYATGKEQMNHYSKCGAMPEIILPPNFQGRRITILRDLVAKYALLDEKATLRMEYLVDEVKKLVLDTSTFRLLLLTLLTNGLVSLSGRDLQAQFLTMFRRRVSSLSDDDNDGLVDTFYRSIGYVGELGQIVARCNYYHQKDRQGQ